MKKYTPIYKTITEYSWSLNFETKIEDEDVDYNVTTLKTEAIKHLREMFAKYYDDDLVAYLECYDKQTIEIEDEPDWDTLHGGKDYD